MKKKKVQHIMFQTSTRDLGPCCSAFDRNMIQRMDIWNTWARKEHSWNYATLAFLNGPFLSTKLRCYLSCGETSTTKDFLPKPRRVEAWTNITSPRETQGASGSCAYLSLHPAPASTTSPSPRSDDSDLPTIKRLEFHEAEIRLPRRCSRPTVFPVNRPSRGPCSGFAERSGHEQVCGG
jgi:hypothetical protein